MCLYCRSHVRSSHDPMLVALIIDYIKLRKLQGEVVYNDMILIPNFMKIIQLVKMLCEAHTRTPMPRACF
jgi:hypothetical protein